MKPKFKIGDEVHLRDFEEAFKVVEINNEKNGRQEYRLLLKEPKSRGIKWLPLFLRVKFQSESQLRLTEKQEHINRLQYRKQQLKSLGI